MSDTVSNNISEEQQMPVAMKNADDKSAPWLTLERINKSFLNVKALSDVSLSIRKGEVHAVVGENGAGKSTLMSIIAGVYQPDKGRLICDGEEVCVKDPASAHRLGIGMVFQELSVIPVLNVVENILPNRLPSRYGVIRKQDAENQVRSILNRLGIDNIDSWSLVGDFPMGIRQLVEIAKALSCAGRLLILDEPTSSLTTPEAERLFEVIDGFCTLGGSVLYISHNLSEVFRIADVITVLRDGKKVDTISKCDTTPESVVSMMVGKMVSRVEKKEKTLGEVSLCVNNLTCMPKFQDVSFSMRQGEIVGLTGMRGSGRSDLARAIFGLIKVSEGNIEVGGKKIIPGCPAEAKSLGLAYVSEDRKDEGLFLDMSVWSNIVVSGLNTVSKYGLMDDTLARSRADAYRELLNIKVSDLHTELWTLSGGNQQKVMIAKWLLASVGVLMVDEPTRGVDVASRVEIHKVLNQLALVGASILLISSDISELLTLSDRIMIMRNGSIIKELQSNEADEEKIVAYATGIGDIT